MLLGSVIRSVVKFNVEIEKNMPNSIYILKL